MRIVIVASEAVPWSKTGGLADVSTALGKSLSSMGHEVTLIVPYHRGTIFAKQNADAIIDSGVDITVPVGPTLVDGRVYWSKLPDSGLRVLLIDQPGYFDRAGLYQEASGDYHDNLERFVFFSRAILEVCSKLVLRPEIIHANDWQTGLVPVLLDIERKSTPGFEICRSVFTIHNLAFQGWFPASAMEVANLDWKYFNWQQMEFYDQLNLLKSGLAFANQITTVSPTYANEIQTEHYGCGLHELLESRCDDLVGILNGIDIGEWNPEVDSFIPYRYGIDSVAEVKPKCKLHLQQLLRLPERSDVPLFGMVSRLTDQKGLDLLSEVAHELLAEDVQFAFLGSGDERYESMIRELEARFPNKVSVTVGFDEGLAHQIEAGSDFYLMPSWFEPCGLNQMYSLAYGTVPLVRRVGGLADSVADTTEGTLADNTATGIVFDEYTGRAFLHAFQRCIELYRDKNSLSKVISAAMARDSSWSQSANRYLSVYENALNSHIASTGVAQLQAQ